MADLVLSCRDRASFCSSVWSSWTGAPFDLHLVAEDGVVGAHSAMILSQSRQLADIVKALPNTTGPTQVLLPGTCAKAVAAVKELICTGSCLLGEAIIPEVLNAVGLLGIKLSMEGLCIENGAIIIPPLNIQNCGDIEEVTASDVRKSHEKISTVSIKTESDDLLSLGTASSPICLDNLKSSCKRSCEEIPGGSPNSQTKEKLAKNNKKKEKVVKKKSPITILQAAYIEEKKRQCEFCPKSFCQEEHLDQHIENVHTTHQCEFCAKKFSRREPLCEHLRAAHNVVILPFRCELCSVTFGKKKVFDRHIQIFHPTELHECKDCQKRFNERDHLAQHIKAAHPKERSHACKHCLTTFSSKSALKAHKKKKHGQSTF